MSLHIFSGYFGYLVLGYYLSNKKFKLKDREMMLIGLIIAVASFAVTADVLISNIGKSFSIYLAIPVVLQSAGLYIAIRYSHMINGIKYSQTIGKIIYSISKYSYGMYFTHIIVIGILFSAFDLAGNPLWIPVILAVVVVLSWLPNYILGKIPKLSKFSGG